MKFLESKNGAEGNPSLLLTTKDN